MDSKSSKPKKIIIVSLILAGVLTVLYGYGLGFLFNSVASEVQDARHINTQLDQPKPHTEALSEAKLDDNTEKEVKQPKSVNPAPVVVTTPEPKAQPKPQPKSEPKPAKKQQMERIPFTSKDVTPGDPESYVGTYGQCPFYENAMSPKGCTPPPDIKCNADWSDCEYIGTRWEE